MRALILASLCTLFSTPAFAAYYGLLDNGEVMGPGKYKVATDAQILTENGGLNVGATADVGFDEEFGFRGLVGFGKTDVYVGGLVKWMPVPDIENQPAMGFNLGLLYANDGDHGDVTFRFEPLMSKRLVIEQTVFTPYVSLPLGIRMRNSDDRAVKDDTQATVQLVIGSQLQVEKWKNLQFIGEVGIDLEDTPGYISAGAIFYFDSQNGFSLE